MLDRLHSLNEIKSDFYYDRPVNFYEGNLVDRRFTDSITYPCLELNNGQEIAFMTGDRLFFYIDQFKEYYEMLLINDRRIRSHIFMPYLDSFDMKHFNEALEKKTKAVLIRPNC